ncbi:signal peptidase II [Desulforudis sp. 1088]|uniref:signal peptidase II n=1 Tax=unclassified Candidatus Desulforudis TaxID=2635950 RepID=UPI003CE488ED
MTTLLTVVFDQASKWVIAAALPLGVSVPVIPGILYLTHIHNPGGAFGLLNGQTGVLTGVTVAVVLAAFVGHRKIVGTGLAVPAGLILGGAVGNLIDRLRWQGVVDFIDFRVWPVFNVADVAIVSGVVLVLLKSYCKHAEE